MPAYIRSLRPNYPYSVIPGGAYTPAELRYINTKDDVVRAHYADFDLKSAHMVRLTADRYEYVSYRIKNRVYWTAKKLRIPEGEYLLTDGVHYARSRCGNRLSSEAPGQISSQEPVPALLSPPPFQPGSFSNIDLTPVPWAQPTPVGVAVESTPGSADRLAPVLPRGVTGSFLPEQPPQVESLGASSPAASANAFSSSPSTPFIGATGGSSLAPLGSAPPELPITVTPETPSPVPEPATILFFLTFLVTLWMLTRVMAVEEKSDGE